MKKYSQLQSWNDWNQVIKISDLNRDLNQMIFLQKAQLRDVIFRNKFFIIFGEKRNWDAC